MGTKQGRRGLGTVIFLFPIFFPLPGYALAYWSLFLKPVNEKKQDTMCFCLWQSSMHLTDIFKALSVLLCALGSSNHSTLQRILETFHSGFSAFLACFIA